MSGGNFTHLTEIVAFIIAIWYAGRLCRMLHISPIIGEIFAGIVMGPRVADIVPEVVKKHGGYDSLWQVVGDMGVTLMIAESGTHIHFDKLKKVGVKALGVAIVGTLLPLVCGMILSALFTEDPPNGKWTEAFAAGCTLAPTSVGIALALLSEAKQLNSLPGQLIVTAAFLDDVFSIVLLVVLEAIGADLEPEDGDGHDDDNFRRRLSAGGGGNMVTEIALAFIWCFLFLGLGVLAAVYVIGKLVPPMLAKFEYRKGVSYQPRDEVHIMVMLALLLLYGYIGHLIGSHLLGAFIAGMSFGQVQRSMLVWRRQVKRLAAWMIRFFFAATVAFSIPVGALFNAKAFGYGLVMAAVPGIMAKVLAGMVAWENRWVVGFAMVGRGEFAYVVAGTAVQLDMLSDEIYAIIVWALLLAVIIAPLAFGYVLEASFKDDMKSGIKYFRIESSGPHHTGLHHEIVSELHGLNLDIIEAKVETDGYTDMYGFTVACGEGDELDAGKLHEIEHDLLDAINDPQTQIMCRPLGQLETENLMDLQLVFEEDTADAQLATDLMHEASASRHSASDLRKGSSKRSRLMQSHSQRTYRDKTSHKIAIIDKTHWVEVRLMATHCPELFAEVSGILEEDDLVVAKALMEGFGHTDSEVIFAKANPESTDGSTNVDMAFLKRELTSLLARYTAGDVMVRRVPANTAILPDHPKLSDLLQTGQMVNNPLLAAHGDDEEAEGGKHAKKSQLRGGFEVEIHCQENAELVRKVFLAFRDLELDVRRLKIEMDESAMQQRPGKTTSMPALSLAVDRLKQPPLEATRSMSSLKAHSMCDLEFFATEKQPERFNAHARRREIEEMLAGVIHMLSQAFPDVFTMSAKIDIRAIEMKHETHEDHAPDFDAEVVDTIQLASPMLKPVFAPLSPDGRAVALKSVDITQSSVKIFGRSKSGRAGKIRRTRSSKIGVVLMSDDVLKVHRQHSVEMPADTTLRLHEINEVEMQPMAEPRFAPLVGGVPVTFEAEDFEPDPFTGDEAEEEEAADGIKVQIHSRPTQVEEDFKDA